MEFYPRDTENGAEISSLCLGETFFCRIALACRFVAVFCNPVPPDLIERYRGELTDIGSTTLRLVNEI